MIDTIELLPKIDVGEGKMFNETSKDSFKEQVLEAVNYIQGFLDKKSFYVGETKEIIKRGRDLATLEDVSCEQSIDRTLEQVKELYLDNTISFHAPNYVSHLNCPVVLPAIVADLITTSVNTAIETWDQSTTATFIEQEVIRFFSKQFKFGQNCDGVFTSGGTQSNLMALLIARDNYALKYLGVNIKQNGWHPEISKFKIFCSDKSHFSIKKAAALLGIGYDGVVPVASDDKMRMDVDAFQKAVEETISKGGIPMAVVATLGTTDYGSFDPFDEIEVIAKKYNMWLHVDGAYGGCFVLTNTHKHLFENVNKADSMTLDFHKTLFQPVCCSAVLINDKDHFKYVSYYADYLNPIEDKDPERPNLIEKSIQTTRRFDALKVWMTLKTLGIKTIASYLEKVHFLAKELHEQILEDTCFESAHTPFLSTVVFRYKTPNLVTDKDCDVINSFIRSSLFKTGKAAIASTRLNGNLFLKFTLLNPKTTINDLNYVLGLIKEKAEEYKNENK